MKHSTKIKWFISTILYSKFNYKTKLFKKFLKAEAKNIQDELDRQHKLRDNYNKSHETDYTTKKVMDIIG